MLTEQDYAYNFSKRGEQISYLLCPSDDAGRAITDTCSSNYRGCVADLRLMLGTHNSAYSAAMTRSWLRVGPVRAGTASPPTANTGGAILDLSAITDGLSNTVLLSEGAVWDGTENGKANADYRSNLCGAQSHYNRAPKNFMDVKGAKYKYATGTVSKKDDDRRLGARAYDACLPYGTAFHTLLPPNSPSGDSGNYGQTISASGYHTGGVNVAFGDGAIRFVSNTIHTKNLGVASSSDTTLTAASNGDDAVSGQAFSYGLWSELGSINGGESAALD